MVKIVSYLEFENDSTITGMEDFILFMTGYGLRHDNPARFAPYTLPQTKDMFYLLAISYIKLGHIEGSLFPCSLILVEINLQ